MGLDEYNEKRRFDETTEPEGKFDKANGGRFVVQRHDASHLHYDLRLEMEGVLKSWAVPKGPSLNPEDKRLAVQTEDHPVKYLSFQGSIPKGNYGAGEMRIWDTGRYTIQPTKKNETPIEQFKAGNLKVNFQGAKLKGVFALVKTHFGKEEQNNWLLIKKKDKNAVVVEYNAENFAPEKGKEHISKSNSKSNSKNKSAPEEEVLQEVKPMLAKTGKKIFDDKDWIYEFKWDGYRTMAAIENGKVQLYSRNGLSQNQKFAPIAEVLKSIEHTILLDGEMVILNSDGLSVFQELQHYDGGENPNLVYYVFDLLYLNGYSTTQLPLLNRKALLKDIIENADLKNVRFCDHIETLGSGFYEKAVDLGFEGVMAKKASSQYFPGVRSDDWIKFKNVNDREAIICGYTDSDGAAFGSLILGAYEDEELTYIGNCGSGFSTKSGKELLMKMKKLGTRKSPFPKKPNLKGRNPHWILPKLICDVAFSEITKSGSLRHPVFKRLREDRSADEINIPEIPKETSNTSSRNGASLMIDGTKVPVSNPDKIYFPGEGIRKYDLIDYYISVADTILPYLKDRPENLHRHPNGIGEEGFYQKDSENLPKWLKTISLASKSAGKDIDYLLCQNEATLIYMANLGCIEINPWSSKTGNLDNPTYTVIDIDPSEKTKFQEVVKVALVAKEILDKAKINGYCKTSGSTGLHIYIPLAGKYSYEDARSFAQIICHFIHIKLPKATSMERVVKARKGKIYLDYMQNNRGQTLAAPYCVRPKPGATVSAPLKWEEVNSKLDMRDYTIFTMPERIESEGDLFTKVLTEKTDIGKAIDNLE